MAKKIGQLRYPKDSNTEITGNIINFSIYATPGTKFTIETVNGQTASIVISPLGVFQLDEVPASKISFEKDTGKENQMVIIDYILEE